MSLGWSEGGSHTGCIPSLASWNWDEVKEVLFFKRCHTYLYFMSLGMKWRRDSGRSEVENSGGKIFFIIYLSITRWIKCVYFIHGFSALVMKQSGSHIKNRSWKCLGFLKSVSLLIKWLGWKGDECLYMNLSHCSPLFKKKKKTNRFLLILVY